MSFSVHTFREFGIECVYCVVCRYNNGVSTLFLASVRHRNRIEFEFELERQPDNHYFLIDFMVYDYNTFRRMLFKWYDLEYMA